MTASAVRSAHPALADARPAVFWLDDPASLTHGFGIDCDWEQTGELSIATAPHQLAELEELAVAMGRAGHHVELLDAAAVRQRSTPRRTSVAWRTHAAPHSSIPRGWPGVCAGSASTSVPMTSTRSRSSRGCGSATGGAA